MKRSRRKTCQSGDVDATVYPSESSAARNTLGRKGTYRSDSTDLSPTFQGYFPVMDTIKRAPMRTTLVSPNNCSRSIIEDSLPEENGLYLETKIANCDSSINDSFNQHENAHSSLTKDRASFDNECSIFPQTLVNCEEVICSNVCLTTPNLDETCKIDGFKPKANNDNESAQAKCSSPAKISTTDLCRSLDLLQGVISFVDVRSGHDNRSEGVAKVLEKLGAIVERKLTPRITHVVFSNGRQSTLNFADKHDVFLVSVLWVDSCLQTHIRADESLFPASRSNGISQNKNKMNRLKSMQPKAFEEDMKNSAKLEERRRKRKILKGKKAGLPFELISLEEIEMNDIFKKMQEPTSAINSPIATQSPFLEQVMRKLSEKRASLEGSPECTKVDEIILQNEENYKEALDGEEDVDRNDDALCRNSDELFERETYALGTESTKLANHDLGIELGVDDNIPRELNLKNQCNDTQEYAMKIDRSLYLGSDGDEIESTRYKKLGTAPIETDGPNMVDYKENGAEPTFSGEGVDTKAISKANATKKPKFIRKKLLSKSQVLSCSPTSESTAMINTSGKVLEVVKSKVKFTPKRKRSVEVSSRKRRKGVASKMNADVQDDIASACDHCAERDGNETEHTTETERISPNGTMKKRSRLNLKQPSSSKNMPVSKRSLVMTSMHYGQQEFVRNTVKRLGSFSITKTVNSTTTHVVAGNGRRTLNILNAIAQGCWIVSPSWVSDSCEQGGWLDEEPYELEDLFPSAKPSRYSKLETGRSLSSSLFENLEPIYVAESTVPPKFELLKLIRKCGGQVTSNAKIAHVCVGDSSGLELDCQLVSEKWILDCVMKTTLLDIDDYVIGKGNTSLTY